MSVKTNNVYGRISISNATIAKFVSHVGMDSYGIVEFAEFGFLDKIAGIFKPHSITKGVKVSAVGDRIGIDVYIVAKYGVSIRAVAEALKESIKYKVEKFSGMLVGHVNVNIIDVRK
ncbi:MAG: Asp23/Gls24 family envelope stress response protein [Clostridia bacterium]|nr:Asp23/Gls24 family envelope stress response protein [Clostridia bacterium]